MLPGICGLDFQVSYSRFHPTRGGTPRSWDAGLTFEVARDHGSMIEWSSYPFPVAVQRTRAVADNSHVRPKTPARSDPIRLPSIGRVFRVPEFPTGKARRDAILLFPSINLRLPRPVLSRC